MAETKCKYYKQKRQVSYDGGATWQDVIPYQYQKGALYEHESADCGAVVVYRWVNMDASTDYYCEGTTKYYKQKKQVSYDGGQTWIDVSPAEYQRGGVAEQRSTDCGYVPPTPQYRWIKSDDTICVEILYRWVNMDASVDYYCEGTTKYYKQKKQVSNDGGQTWQDVTPPVYQKGGVAEEQSTDCGYVPPTPTTKKFEGTYSGGRTKEVECNGDGTLTSGETHPYWYEEYQMTNGLIGNCVTVLGHSSFRDCSGLTSVGPFGSGASVIVPNSVTTIGDWAFLGCSGLTSVTIPNSVTNIGVNAFGSCNRLRNVTIPNSVTSIGNNAFFYCSGLTSVVIPSSITAINDDVFGACFSLTSVTIPNSVTSIGNYAFNDCSGLTTIRIPDSVISIGDWAFNKCRFTNITIPNSVTNIGEYTFADCSSLRGVTLSNNITSISKGTFRGSGLTNITIPNGVTSIGDYAFWSCYSLTGVSIPNSVTSIGEHAFDDTENRMSLTNITIPDSVTSIGDWAFNGCRNLTVTINATTPPTLGANPFSVYPKYPIYVPASSVSTYKNAEGWSQYASRIQAIP